jgi:acyl carrier protein
MRKFGELKLENELIAIFSKILSIHSDQDILKLQRSTCENWDSLATMQLIVTLEDVFQVRLDTQDLELFDSYLQILTMIKGKLANRPNGT